MTVLNFTYRLQPQWQQYAAKYGSPDWSPAAKKMGLTGQRICPKAVDIAAHMAKIGVEVFPVIVPAKSPRYNFLMYAKKSGAYYFKGSRDDFAKGGEIVVESRFVTKKIIRK